MQLLERITLTLFAASVIFCSGSLLHRHLLRDTTAPTIHCVSDTVDVNRSHGESALLQGLCAHDGREDNLTDRIFIQGISPLLIRNTAAVTYGVSDPSGNMSFCTRTVRCVDDAAPRFALHCAPVYPVNGDVQLLDRLQAHDARDGDLSGNIHIISHNVNTAEPGVYSVTAQVSNHQGNTETVQLKLVVTETGQPMPPILHQYIVYLPVGSTFDAAAYVVPEYKRAVRVAHQVDTSAPGTYFACYTYEDHTVYQTVVVG